MKHRLADKILSFAPWRSIRGVKAVSFEEYTLREKLGYEPAMPESLAIGAMLEMGNWLTILSSDFAQMAWPVEIDDCQLHQVPRPGESLLIGVELLDRSDRYASFRGRATIERTDAILIDSWRAELVPLDSYCDAADLRVLLSELTEAS